MARALYAHVVMDVMGTGNLFQMTEIARQAEEQLAGREVKGYEAGGEGESDDEGNLEEALALLKAEIAKAEGS